MTRIRFGSMVGKQLMCVCSAALLCGAMVDGAHGDGGDGRKRDTAVDPLGAPMDVAPLLRRVPQPAPRTAGTKDVGAIAVLSDDGSLVPGGVQTNTPVIVNRFYETHGDEYDQLIVHVSSSYIADVEPEAGFAFFQIVAGFTDGIARFQGNPNADDGLTRLGGFANMNDLPEYPADATEDFFGGMSASYVEIFGQEFGHQWLAFVQPHPVTGADILGRGNAHWSFFLHHPGEGNASPMEGNRWLPIINGFVTREAFTGFCELDEYIMGVRPPEDVTPFFVIDFEDQPPFPDSRFPEAEVIIDEGFPINLQVQDIIDNHGPRQPDTRFSMKRFRAAFILVTPPGLAPSDADLQKLDAFRVATEAYFNDATEGLGTLDTTLGPGQPVNASVFATPDTFEGNAFDAARYEYWQGVTIDSDGLNEPSGTQSMRLNGDWGGGDQIRSWPVDLSAVPSGQALLRYAVQRTGSGDAPDDNEALLIEYYSTADEWVELHRFDAPGPDQQSFTTFRRALPDDGLFDRSRFRIRRDTDNPGPFGDWFVDDVSLTVGPPCLADLNGDGVVNVFDLLGLFSRWGTTGIGADISAPIDVLNVEDVIGLLASWGPCPTP